MTKFCERLKEIRMEKGLTQSQLSIHLKIANTTVMRWESGEIIPSIENLNNLCNFFDVSADYLLGRTDIY